ncbi:hypothetical protein HRbin06_01006 [archaeon HR06]|nr:hypothetical protein HRbin06_01006 [archaeon HR06]
MAKLEILDKTLYKREIVCSSCSSPSLSLSLSCPYCLSKEVYLNTLKEHIPCGYIGSIEKVCPKCNREVKEEEIKVSGKWFECKACGRKIREPRIVYQCRLCKREHTIEDVKFDNIYQYTLNPKILPLLNKFLNLTSKLFNIFYQRGFNIIFNGSIEGSSGVNHPFHLVVKKGNEKIGIDFFISFNDGINDEVIVKFFAKVLDIKSSTLFVAYPYLKDSAKNLAELYKLSYIEVEKMEIKDLEKILDNLMKKKSFLLKEK